MSHAFLLETNDNKQCFNDVLELIKNINCPNEYKDKCVKNIVDIREHTKKELAKLGFTGLDTKTNFVFVTHEKINAEDLFMELKNRGILVRYYKEPKLNKYLRITIGTEVQMEQVINTIKDIMTDWGVA